MKKLIYLLLPLMTSCSVTYIEVYHLEKHPINLNDTIYTQSTHWHIQNSNKEWECIEIPADTFSIVLSDTIVETTYMGTYKKKEHNTKWNLKKLESDGKKCH